MAIDPSTTAGKIAVMKAFDSGEWCEWQPQEGGDEWRIVDIPSWNWDEINYRIKPRDPREFYVTVYPEYMGKPRNVGHVHTTEESARKGTSPRMDVEIIKVREVIE